MAIIQLDVGDVDQNRVLNAVAIRFSRPDTVPNPSYDPQLPIDSGNPLDIDNPETKGAFAKRQIINFLKDTVRTVEARAAREVAVSGLNPNVDIT